MSNTFKTGDKVTINKGLNSVRLRCTCDTTQGTAYTLIPLADSKASNPEYSSAISFKDDKGDVVTINYCAVTLA